MFFESILKRKEDMKKSIQGNPNELYNSGLRQHTPTSPTYPTWTNYEHSQPSKNLKKTNSLSQFKKDVLKGSILTSEQRAHQRDNKANNLASKFSKYQKAEHDVSLLRNGRSDPALKFHDRQPLFTQNSDNKNKGNQIGFQELMERNRNLLQKCQFQDKQIQYLKNESKNLRESRILSSTNLEKDLAATQKENVSAGQANIQDSPQSEFYKKNHQSTFEDCSSLTLKSPLNLEQKQIQSSHSHLGHQFIPSGPDRNVQKSKSLMAIIQTLEKHNSSLKKQLEDKSALFQNANEQLKGKNIQYQIQIDKLKFQNNNLKTKITILEKKVTELTAKISDNEAIKEIKQLKSRLKESDNDRLKLLGSSQSEKEKFEILKDEWNQQKKQMLQNIDQLRKESREHYDQKMTLSSQYNQMVMEKIQIESSLQEKSGRLEAENKFLLQKGEELQKQLEYFKRNEGSRVNILKAENAQKEESFTIKIKQYQAIHLRLEEQNKNLNIVLLTLEEKIKSLEATIKINQDLKVQQNQKMQEKLKEKQKKIDQIKQKIMKKEQNIEELLVSIQQLKQNVFAKDVVIREKRSTVKELQEKLNSIEQKNTQRIENENMMKQFASLKSSYSNLQADLDEKSSLLQERQQIIKQQSEQIVKLQEGSGNQEGGRLSLEIASVSNELQSIKAELLEKYRLFHSLVQILNFEPGSEPSHEDVLVAVENIIHQLTELEETHAGEPYREVLSIFGVSPADDANIHEKLLHEINAFKECQKDMINALKQKDAKIQSLEWSLRKAKGEDQTRGQQHYIIQKLQKTIQSQNQEILKYRFLQTNNKYQNCQ